MKAFFKNIWVMRKYLFAFRFPLALMALCGLAIGACCFFTVFLGQEFILTVFNGGGVFLVVWHIFGVLAAFLLLWVVYDRLSVRTFTAMHVKMRLEIMHKMLKMPQNNQDGKKDEFSYLSDGVVNYTRRDLEYIGLAVFINFLIFAAAALAMLAVNWRMGLWGLGLALLAAYSAVQKEKKPEKALKDFGAWLEKADFSTVDAQSLAARLYAVGPAVRRRERKNAFYNRSIHMVLVRVLFWGIALWFYAEARLDFYLALPLFLYFEAVLCFGKNAVCTAAYYRLHPSLLTSLDKYFNL